MKKAFSLMVCFTLILNLSACSIRKDYLGFHKKDFIVIEEADTHGGFHGDGSYYMILDCSKNKEKAFKNVSGWNELPLSENLNLIMYGGEKDGVIYGHNLAAV